MSRTRTLMLKYLLATVLVTCFLNMAALPLDEALSTITVGVDFCDCNGDPPDNSPPKPVESLPPTQPPPPPPTTSPPRRTTRRLQSPLTSKPGPKPTSTSPVKPNTPKPEKPSTPIPIITITRKPVGGRHPTQAPRPPPPGMIPPQVEMMFILDRSSRSATSKAKDAIKMVDEFQKFFLPESKFGLSVFSDIPAGGGGTETAVYLRKSGAIQENIEPAPVDEGCYTRTQSLTTDTKQLKSQAKGHINYLSGAQQEPPATALLISAADLEAGWSPGRSAPSVKKVMIIMTDAGPFEGPHRDDYRTFPKGDGEDECVAIKTPRPPQLGKILNREGILLFGLFQDEDVSQKWIDGASRMGVKLGYVHTSDSEMSEIASRIKKFIGFIKE